MTDENPFEVDPREGLARWIRLFADAGLSPDDTEADRLRKRVLTLTVMTVVAVVSVLAVTYAVVGLTRAAIVPAAYVIVTGIAFVVFAKTKNDIPFRNVQLVLYLIFPPVLQWVLGGYLEGSAVVMLAAIAPVLALMLLGRRWSAALLVLFAIIAVGAGLADVVFEQPVSVVPSEVVVGLIVMNMVGLVTIVYFPLAFYIMAYGRAHDALQAERRRSERLMISLLPASVASRLKAGEQVIADQLSGVAVLFADMVGFTSATERLPAQEIVRRLNEAFTVFDRLTEARGLDKIKTIGDSYMVAGGITSDDPQSVHDVADLALAMRESAKSLSIDAANPLQLRFGIDVGPVIAGVVGEQMLVYDIYGDVVNTASRMASHGTPNQIHVTGRVRARLDGEFELESRGSIPIKGKGEMETFFLERPKKLQAPENLEATTPRIGYIGRADEAPRG